MCLELKFIIWALSIVLLVCGSGALFMKGYKKNQLHKYVIMIILLVIFVFILINSLLVK